MGQGAGIQLAIQAMLVSPHFLFRIERDPNPDDPAGHQISRPRTGLAAELLPVEFDAGRRAAALAEAASCATPAVLRRAGEAHAGRSDGPPRSPTTSPASGWRRATSTSSSRIRKKFPEWGPELRDAMKTETRMFFEARPAGEPAAVGFLDAQLHFPE